MLDGQCVGADGAHNDEGWETIFTGWLKGSRLRPAICVWVFSVGGGSKEKKYQCQFDVRLGIREGPWGKNFSVVGRDGGYTAKVADACVVVRGSAGHHHPARGKFSGVIWHLIVSDRASCR